LLDLISEKSLRAMDNPVGDNPVGDNPVGGNPVGGNPVGATRSSRPVGGNEVEPTGGRQIGRDLADAIGAARN
jgi:hypothetical protein